MKATDFYTVPKSEAGIRVPLSNPDGSDSGEWLLIVGPDSKAYAKAASELNRAVAAFPEDPVERATADGAAYVDYLANLVIGWSFEDDFNEAALRAFLKNSPGIAMQVHAIATDRSRFFGPASLPSTPGPMSADVSAPEIQAEPQAVSA
jgi:hypothetical protein